MTHGNDKWQALDNKQTTKPRGLAAMSTDQALAIQTQGGQTKRDYPRGFAALSPERRKEIAIKGGKASTGNFKHDRLRAKQAGRLGGLVKRKEQS